MKTLKTADYIIQWVLIAGALFINLFMAFRGRSFDEFFFGSYFIVGGWQVMSVIAHFFLPSHVKVHNRKIYQWCLLTVLVMGLIVLVASDVAIFYLMGLILVSPVMAIYYAVICTNETKRLVAVPA